MKFILFFFLAAVTLYSRFLNLNWDRGWGFHPDENNLWGASRNAKLFSSLDPKFYAYGGFPIYLYSFLDSKIQARAVSALLQTGIIGLLFLTGKKLKGPRTGLLAALMGIFSAGLVQSAHFLTVESLLGFFGLTILFSLLKYPEGSRASVFWLLTAAVTLGLGIGTKISFGVFVLPFATLLRPGLGKPKARPLLTLLLALGVAAFIFLFTNPFLLNKWSSVLGTLKYESGVAMGNLSVFYTRQFIGTTPGWFQAIHVFPYITGWLFLPMFLIGAFVVFFKVRPWHTPRSNLLMLLTILASLLSFLPMWAKWTRYVVQVLPIFILIAGIGADWIWEKGRIGKTIVFLAIVLFLPQFFSVMKVYGSVDNRLAAADWAAVNIPSKAKIFTEAMDLGIIPFNPVHGQNITLFNFYELDEDKTNQKKLELDNLVNESDYFISVSNRVYGNSLRLQNRFSASAEFYRRLFDGSLGYREVYPAEQDPALQDASRLGLSFSPEETFQVFDHPTVMIFKRTLKH